MKTKKMEVTVEDFSMAPRVSVQGVRLRVYEGMICPSVCVKVPPLYWRLPEDVRGKDNEGRIFNVVAEEWWMVIAPDVAVTCFSSPFDGYLWECNQDGRSNGHLVVTGLGDPRTWSIRKHAAWKRFEKCIKKSMLEAEKQYVERLREKLAS